MSRRIPLTAALVTLLVTGCASSTEPPRAPSASLHGESTLDGDLVVFAAASLTDAFGEIADAFTADNPDVTVSLNFGGSSQLAQGIVTGAPADVFASASPATMQTVIDAGLADDEPAILARNILQIAVPPGNPGNVTSIRDFADPARVIALCAPEVPCGAAAARVFEAAGVTPAPDTLEEDVRAALTKVELGEVDAAMVYRTDVLASDGRVEGIGFDEAGGAVNDYPIVALTDAPNPDAADAFVQFALSEDGQAILADAGFQTE